MAPFSSIINPFREFFWLPAAERTVRGYAPAQQARVRAHFDGAERRLAAGRRVGHNVAAAVLLREAVSHYLSAMEAASLNGTDAVDAAGVAATMPPLPPDPMRPTATPTDDARVRAALSTLDPLYFDRLSPEDVARARWALERAARMLRRRVEARSLSNVRGTRWGRLAALGLLIAYGLVAWTRAAVMTPNIALGKPVRLSSNLNRSFDGHELVDGEIGTSYGIQTINEESPNVIIDLLDTYRIEKVDVYNRVDGWFDDCLPLVVEFSTNGASYSEIGRRDEHFDPDAPWVVAGHQRLARFVRLRVARRSYLALSEVEVFGHKP